MQEKDAIARLKRGDIGGLETLVHLYQTRALRASYLVSRNYALAEDIVQTMFIRAYEQIHQFDERKAFGPWFLRSVINETLMAVTRRQVTSLDDQTIEGSVLNVALEPRLEELLEAAETREAIWATLEHLSPNQRAAVVMRYYLGLTDGEISAQLDCPPGTVRRRLHDARARLRHLLPTWITQPLEE